MPFVWRKEIDRMDIAATHVLRLYRSLNLLQIALPGVSSQEATVYLGAFKTDKGILVAVIFHFQATGKLVFYLYQEGAVSKKEAPRVLEEGIVFAESMGFMLSDMDYQLLGPDEQEALWESLPLRLGGAEPPAPVAETAPRPSAEAPEMPEVPEKGKKKMTGPSPDHTARCRELLENYGRFLASF